MENYEITISPNYVNNWGVKEAIRELLQNAIDAETCGYEKHIYYNAEKQRLSITNMDASLSAKDLILGCSNKEDQEGLIGKYGEGFKLALVVLLRKGMNVLIYNGEDKLWTPSFKMSEKFKTQVLNIEETFFNEMDPQLTFEISPIDESLFNSLKDFFPCIENDFGETVDSNNGQVLLDKRFKGKMYVSGLYIQTDNNFEYGYNFNSDVVELDRDRRAINYYELRGLTAEAIVTAENCHPKIFKAISNSCVDVKDIEEVLDEASESFLEEYRDMLYEEKHLQENTLVATESVMKQLQQMDVDVPVVQGTEIESYLIAKANDKLGLIEEAKEIINQKSNELDALDTLQTSAYRNLMLWFIQNKKYLTKKAIAEFLTISSRMKPSGFYYISKYINDDFDYSDEAIENLRDEFSFKEEKVVELEDSEDIDLDNLPF